MGPNDFQQENIAISETVKEETQNRFLDEYNGKPTIEKLHQIIAQKRKNGDTDRKVTVDMMWLLELLDFYYSGTNATVQMVQDAPDKLYKMDQRMLQAQDKANLEHRKAQDLLVENTLMAERMETMSEEYKEKLTGMTAKINNNIIKLPISKVNSFLKFCTSDELNNPIEQFYVKINDNGNMERIVRKPEEL